jgi:hypothetical protein
VNEFKVKDGALEQSYISHFLVFGSSVDLFGGVVLTGDRGAEKSRDSRFQNYGSLFFNRVPYVGITRTGSRGHSIHLLVVGISQQTSSPSIFYLFSLILLACQQEFADKTGGDRKIF